MCLVNCEVVEGLIPSERIVRIVLADGGHEEVVVPDKLIQGGSLVASEIGRDRKRVLVELPRESASGRWRIWVDESQLGAKR